MMYDIIVLGSGACGVNAAFPLTAAGFQVAMVDFGHTDNSYASIIPELPFWEIRESDKNQHRYFLGDHYEGISLGKIPVGAQLTPPRQYITHGVSDRLPIDSSSFFPLESLAAGGLASGWGANAYPFSKQDMAQFPLEHQHLIRHFETVAERIGISGEYDDLLPFYGSCASLQPPLKMDKNGESILSRYKKIKFNINKGGLYLGRSRQAVITQPFHGRNANQYFDMSFWGDKDRSVYRPTYTLQELKAYENFTYHQPVFGHSFIENSDNTIEIIGYDNQGREVRIKSRYLILAAGVLGTIRIVLRSLNKYDVKVPILSNPYSYVSLLNMNVIGTMPYERNHSLAQLAAIFKPPNPEEPEIHITAHTYRSLLNFKLIKETPLPFPESMALIRRLIPALTVLAFSHEDRPANDKYCTLHHGEPGDPDRLEIVYEPSRTDQLRQNRHEKMILKLFRKMGGYHFKTIRPGHAASIHYGGTLAMVSEPDELTVDISCRLYGTRSVYIADASVFPYLPAKGQTFTAMANANRVGQLIMEKLKQNAR